MILKSIFLKIEIVFFSHPSQLPQEAVKRFPAHTTRPVSQEIRTVKLRSQPCSEPSEPATRSSVTLRELRGKLVTQNVADTTRTWISLDFQRISRILLALNGNDFSEKIADFPVICDTNGY